MLPLLVLLLPAFVAAAPSVVAAEPPVVTLRQGVFTGVVFGQPGYKWNVKAFMGVPYAQPPVQNLRLRPPLPMNDSSEHFDASQFGIECPQASLIPAYYPRHFGNERRLLDNQRVYS
jgi:para-nitrobenzyl esterase